MWAVHDDESRQRASAPEGGHPGEAASPVVADEQCFACAGRTDQAFDVRDEQIDLLVRDATGTGRTSIAAQVRCPDPIAQSHQRGYLVPPREGALRKSMEAECQPVSCSFLRHFEPEAISLDESDPGGACIHWKDVNRRQAACC